MFDHFNYFPIINIKPAEISALQHLPGPDKDAFLPIIGLKKWANSKSLDNSVLQIEKGISSRSAVLDLGNVGAGTGADEELFKLKEAAGGFKNWIAFLRNHENFIPALQTNSFVKRNFLSQVDKALSLDRGIAIRLRRKQEWNANAVEALEEINFGGQSVLLILDVEQLEANFDLLNSAALMSQIAVRARDKFKSSQLTICPAGSSFPSEFASINRQHAKINIRERQLQHILNQLSAQSKLGIEFRYGDYASVFAGDRGFAQTGNAVRIDYPSRFRWIYHRRENEAEGWKNAANAVTSEAEWNNELTIWGAERIRRAAIGELDGMKYQRDWVAVRINLHLHQQTNFDGGDGLLSTDEPWKD